MRIYDLGPKPKPAPKPPTPNIAQPVGAPVFSTPDFPQVSPTINPPVYYPPSPPGSPGTTPANPVDKPTGQGGTGYDQPADPGGPKSMNVKYTGYTPDYTKLIGNDSGWKNFLDTYSANAKANLLGRQAAVRAALSGWGMIPDFAKLGLTGDQLGYTNDDLNQSTRDAASANEASGLSTHAQLARSHDQNMMAIRQHLGAVGMLSSGEYGFQSNNENQRDAVSQNNALQTVLGGVNKAYTDYAGAESQRGMDYQTALDAAIGRERQLPEGVPIQAYSGPATWNAASGTYVDPYGTHYDAGGRPIVPAGVS